MSEFDYGSILSSSNTLTPTSPRQGVLLSPSSSYYNTLLPPKQGENGPFLTGRRTVYISAISIVLDNPVKGPVYLNLIVNGRRFLKLSLVYEINSETPLRWKLDPYYSFQEGNDLTVQIKRRKYWPKTSVLAEGSLLFQDAWNIFHSNDGTGLCQYTVCQSPTITLDLASDPDVFTILLEPGIKLANEVQSVLAHLGKSRRFLVALMQYGVAISEIDPIAKAILACVNVTYKRLRENDKCDKIVVDLAEDLARSLDYAANVGQFARLPQLKKTLEQLRPLVEDTTNFILRYSNRSRSDKLFNSSPVRSQVEDLVKRFSIFREQFDTGLAIQSGATLEVLLERLISSKDDHLLQELKPRDTGNSGIRVAECMDGTRLDVLSSIEDWVEDLRAPNILWIRGFPGVGKSAIASSIIQTLRQKNRLGAFYIFERARATAATPNALWRSVAYDLARTYPTFRRIVVERLDDEEVDVDSSNIKAVFRNIIEDPLEGCNDIPSGRLPVVVVDALDECGGLRSRHSPDREGLLSTLSRWADLPPKFKLLVTSRGDEDIERVLTPIAEVFDLSSGNNVKEQATEDIGLFLKNRFLKIARSYPDSLDSDWPGDMIRGELTQRTAGLFIWAQTLMTIIDEEEPQTQLDQVLRGAIGLGDMGDLYTRVLEISFGLPGAPVTEAFQTIVGSLVVAKRPLSRAEIIDLHRIEPSMLDYVRKGLRCVLEDGNTLQFSHQSFVEFLLDSAKCPSPFLVVEQTQHLQLANTCISLMVDHLQFNICRIPTSHFRNVDIPGMQLHDSVSSLSYACRFWGEHLSSVPFDEDLCSLVKKFFFEKFLFWLEVLSVGNEMDAAAGIVVLATKWIDAENEENEELLEFLEDAHRFIVAFGGVISQSAPHIYLSALPFAPRNSLVAKRFSHCFPGTLRLQSGHVEDWPPILFAIDGHEAAVNAAAFSFDGKFVVSGSSDTSVCVWNAETGDLVSTLEGHTASVNSVSFAGDGRSVVSGSDDWSVRIWDAESGDMIGEPLLAHGNVVSSVAFARTGTYVVSGSYDWTLRVWTLQGESDATSIPLHGHSASVTAVAISSDDRLVVSGSYDCTVRVWDPVEGVQLYGPFEGHSAVINCVSFSPDGLLVASASDDKTMQLWDIQAEDVAGDPLEGHVDGVTSISFSPDGQKLVSGSHDETVRIWRVATLDLACGPWRGHTDGVTTVSFSSDGERVLSGSRDKTINVWDADPRIHLPTISQAHSDGISAVAFTPDGACIATGSEDNTVRLWDCRTGEELALFAGHTSWVSSISISPDGVYVASGSDDQTIFIWNVETGLPVGSPLTGHRNVVTSVAFFPDSRRLASGSYDETIRVWDVITGEMLLGPLTPHTNWITSVAISPDGSMLASASLDRTFSIMDAESGQIIAGPFEGHDGPINCVAFSPDGKLIASASNDRMVNVWDIDSRQITFQPPVPHDGFVFSVAFSPDGQHLASASADKNIRVWNLETGKLTLGPLEGHTGGVYCIAYSPDGKHLVSGSEDETVRVWDVVSEHVAAEMASVAEVDFADDSGLEKGWIAGSGPRRLLFWVPPWNRNGLWWPRNTLVIAERPTKLDLSCFENGVSWASCHDPQSR